MPKTDRQHLLLGLYGKQVQPGLTSGGLALVGHQVPWCGLGLGGREEQEYVNPPVPATMNGIHFCGRSDNQVQQIS
jgi:hypothetical protein